MVSRRTAAMTMVAIVVITAGTVFVALRGSGTVGTISTTTGQGGAQATTLEDLVAGSYPTAYDRSGTGGARVTVDGLQVLYVKNESDGDWHVAVTDGVVPVVITEITPAYQGVLGRPVAGSIIDETGTTFCDVQHENESFHGWTCWELHPVTEWNVSNGPVQGHTTQPGTHPTISVGYTGARILQGASQTITISVSGQSEPMAGLSASVIVTNIGGDDGTFACTTSQAGMCSVSLPQGADDLIGTYGVEVVAGQAIFYSAFEVLAA